MSAAHNVLDYYPPTPQLQLLQVVPFNITMAIYLKKMVNSVLLQVKNTILFTLIDRFYSYKV